MEKLENDEMPYLMVRRAKMPSTCFGKNNYYRLALVIANRKTLAAEERTEPSMISRRSKGMVALVEVSLPLWKGQTQASQFYQEYERLAERMEEIEKTRVYQDDPYA